VFVGIRQMANLPVESMKTGGLFWFKDLTVSDPCFALPVMTMALLYATIEVSVIIYLYIAVVFITSLIKLTYINYSM